MKIGKDGNVESYECPAEREAFICGNLHGNLSFFQAQQLHPAGQGFR